MANAGDLSGLNSFALEKLGRREDLIWNPAALYVASLSSKVSQRVTLSRLSTLSNVLGVTTWQQIDWHQMDRAWLFLVREKLVHHSPQSINALYSLLKGVAKQAWELALIDEKQFLRIKNTKSIKAVRLPRYQYLKPAIFRPLFDAMLAEDRLQGTRDCALFSLLYGCGLRRAEIVGISIEDIDLMEKSIRILGKGNKERRVYVPEQVWAYLLAWFTFLQRDSGPLFVRVRKTAQLTEERLTDQAVYFLLKDWQLKTGLADCSPHDFRASFITFLLDQGEDIKTVADTVGHADIRTTAIYDRRGEERKKKVAKKIKFD